MASAVGSPDPSAHCSGGVEVSAPEGGPVTVRARGELDAGEFEAALRSGYAGANGPMLIDLTGVTYFSMEDAWVLVDFRLAHATTRLLLRVSSVVERKLATLGVAELFSL